MDRKELSSQVSKSTGKPVSVFADKVDPAALTQFRSAMSQQFVTAGALMPDVHVGYSLPIGAVVATDGVIVPAWVGYDIGCGMLAIRLPVTKGAIAGKREEIFRALYKKIPTGFAHHKKPQVWDYEKIVRTKFLDDMFKDKGGLKQLGTLGSGNHFLEISYDEEENGWVVIHSGSRNVGHTVATHYMRKASPGKKASEGHYGFDVESNDGKDYITDMNFCLEFALENRKQMLNAAIRVVGETIYGSGAEDVFANIDFSSMINRNHNHAVFRNGVWVHRKGATHAENGMKGVVPGNMLDGSFLVTGKGNEKSLASSSHGAGRVLSRKKAKETLLIKDFADMMEKGDVTAKVGKSTIDESPMSYKNIFDVMALQNELVTIDHHLRPIINVKG